MLETLLLQGTLQLVTEEADPELGDISASPSPPEYDISTAEWASSRPPLPQDRPEKRPREEMGQPGTQSKLGWASTHSALHLLLEPRHSHGPLERVWKYPLLQRQPQMPKHQPPAFREHTGSPSSLRPWPSLTPKIVGSSKALTATCLAPDIISGNLHRNSIPRTGIQLAHFHRCIN